MLSCLYRHAWRRARFAAFGAALLATACTAPQSEPVGVVTPGEAGDAARGLAYAEQTCASCHAVAVGETSSPLPEATPFEELAATPGLTGIALSAWLNTSHPTMPDFIVDPDRIDDLAAYLASLDSAEAE
jgi:mono/diheme cytochrome c family protein